MTTTYTPEGLIIVAGSATGSSADLPAAQQSLEGKIGIVKITPGVESWSAAYICLQTSGQSATVGWAWKLIATTQPA